MYEKEISISIQFNSIQRNENRIEITDLFTKINYTKYDLKSLKQSGYELEMGNGIIIIKLPRHT